MHIRIVFVWINLFAEVLDTLEHEEMYSMDVFLGCTGYIAFSRVPNLFTCSLKLNCQTKLG